jgi:hypothetical protein
VAEGFNGDVASSGRDFRRPRHSPALALTRRRCMATNRDVTTGQGAPAGCGRPSSAVLAAPAAAAITGR